MATTPDDVLDVLREHPDPVVTAAEVADDLPVTRRTVLDRLRRLEERGAVVSKQVGAHATAWWLAARPPSEEPTTEPATDGDFPPREPSKEPPTEPAGDDLEAALAEVGTPSMTPDPEEHRAAVSAALDLLASGPQARSDFTEALHPEHAAGYDNDRTWWRRVLKPVLKAHPDVVTPDGGNPWRLRGGSR